MFRPWPSSPQQSIEPSVLTPQVWLYPALTEANSPRGGMAWPWPLLPQQAAEPPALTPHVCQDPTLTEANSPVNGEALR